MHGRQDNVDLHSWESFKSFKGWQQLFDIYIHLLAVIGLGFAFIGAMAASSGAPITEGMLMFFGILSTGSAALATAFLWATSHPNPWVGRAAFAILFAVPLTLMLLD